MQPLPLPSSFEEAQSSGCADNFCAGYPSEDEGGSGSVSAEFEQARAQLGDVGRPCLSPEFLGLMEVVGYCSLYLGAATYNRYLSKWSYRKIWIFSHACLVAFNLLDLVWVTRVRNFDWKLAIFWHIFAYFGHI